MKVVKVFVPGKVHLSGEHAVVYGYPALLSTLSLGVTVTISEAPSTTIFSEEEDRVGLIAVALAVAGLHVPVKMTITSTLPVGSGLGSSAALAAAVIRAAGHFQGVSWSKTEWFEKTLAVERIAHGNPSGGDPAAVISEGFIRFVKGTVPERFSRQRPLTATLVQTGKPLEDTGMMVKLVAEARNRKPAVIGKILEKIGATTEKLFVALTSDGDVRQLVSENGELLEQLGIVSPKGKKISKELRQQGAAVKVSGAGGVTCGSGMLVAVGADEAVVEYCSHFGLPYWRVQLGGILDQTDTISTLAKD